jgi:cytochrome P450
VQQRLQDEVQAVLGGRKPTIEDIPNLQYTLMVIKEAMRLYPPGWILGREPIEPTTIGQYEIPTGSIIFITPYVVHRDGRFFDEPDCFRPERFDAAREKEIPRYAYIPFGGGPRVCVGAGFAMMEMQIVLATIAQRYWMDYPSGEEVEVASGVTLHPAKPIYITFHHSRSTLR